MSNEFPRQPVPSIADPNSKLIFSNDTVTGSSSVVNTGFGAKEVSVVVNILNIPTGTGPGIQFTLQEVDPGDNTTSFGSSSSTSMITGSGVFTASLRSTFAGTIKTSWTVSGSTPSFTGVYTTLVSKSTTVLLGVDSSGNQQQIKADSLGTLITQGSSTGTATPVTGSVSARLTDGAAFYDAAKTGQLPSALVGGRLDVVVGAALPAGTNNIGDVDILSVPAPLSTTGTGTEAAALRVTIATDSTGILSVDDNGSSLTIDSTQLPAALVGGRFDENIGSWLGSTAPSVGQKTMAASVPVVISSDQTAILISGSISATNPSVGTNNSTAPTSTTQIGGSDGTNLQAGRTFDVDTSSDKQYVIGVTLRKSALSGSLEYGTSADPIRVDPTGMTTQPVTGSLTAQLQSGPKGSTAAASVTSTASGANHQPLDVAIYDAAGNQITTFGGGTQYGDGAARTATNVTGTIMMVDDGTNIQSVSGDASGRLNTVISSWFGSTVPTAGQKTMSGSIPFTLASDQGNVIIGISGTISSGNSSTSILTGSQVFTGLGVDTLAAASISIQVFANVASATDGLEFQWSQDNVNWDETLSFTLAASLGQAFMFGPHARFFRVQYTNGVVGQASFRLQTILKPVIVRHDTIRLADVPIGEQDATVVKAVISGKTTAGGGTYVDVKVNPSGAVQVGGSVAITDSGGTNTTAVKAASTAAIATDPALVVAISPNNSVSITAASLPLPSGAAQEHTGSASYNSSRLTDGSAFYDATKTGQLPTSLAGGKLDVNLGTWLGSTVPTAGQKTMSGSIPVVISSDQTAILISGSISATNPSVGTNASTAPVSSTQIGGSDGTNLQSGRVFDVDASSDKQYVLGVTLRKSALSGSLEYGTSADPIRVDPTGTTTQPVTGSLTAQLQSGPKGSTAAASVTSTASGANHQPLDVAIYDAAGNQISTFGGGTQFGDGFARTATNVTGTIMMVDDGTNIQSVSGDSSGRLNTVMSSWFGSTVPTAGQKTMSGSIPFTLASDQSAILISGSITNPSIGTNASTAPTSTTQIGGSDGTNLQAGRIFDVDTSSDKQYVLGVTLRKSALSGSLEYGTSADPIRIDPTGTTTQPVTGSVGITNVVSVTTSGSLPVIINGVATITGSVAITAASLPLPAGAATSANQSTLGSQTTKINDGTNTATVKAASTTVLATDTAIVVALSPNSNDVAVAYYDNGQGESATWDNTTNLSVDVAAIPPTVAGNACTVSISLTRTGTITAGEISFQGSDATGGVWFPVKATRTESFTTENSILLSGVADIMWKVSCAGFFGIRAQLTTQITGAGSVFIATLWDTSPAGDTRSTVGQSDETKLNATTTLKSGLKGSSAAALITSTASGANHQILDVAIYDGSGNQISTFGGGTQYVVDAAAPTTPTGSISLAQRDDQLSTVTPVEGDWIQPRASSKGALWVTIPDVNGDPITSFGGGTQYTVNAVAPADPVGTALVAERDDQLSALSEVEGDWTQVRASSKGALWVTIPDANGDPITSFGGGTQYADGAVRGTSTGTLLMVDDGVNIQSALGNTSGELYTIAKQGQAGTLSGSWPTRITDGTTVSAVKAASTAAVAADPALVVSLSPNSPGYMSQNVTVSSANSSTATLAGAASFVGTSVSTLGVATIQLIVFSDVASSAAGLAIQQSSDGTNWDFTDTFTVYALTGFNTTVAAIGSFARVVYTNGASAQGVFRLQTLLCPVAQLLHINETSAIQSITAQDTATSGTIYSNGQVIYGGTPTANSAVSASLQSWNSCVLQTSGTWSGTLALEASIDGGVTWTKKSLHLAGTDIQAMSFTSNFFGGLNTTGYSNVRIRSTAAWTGTATVRYIQSEDLNSVFIGNALRNADSSGNIQPAADIASRKFFTAVTDGTNTATVKAASVTALGADTALVTQLRSASSGTITNVSSSVTSVQLIAANTARIGAVIFNDSTSVCFVKFGIAAGPTNFTYRLTTNAVLEIPWSYTGRIDGIWTTANGNARITELV